MRRLTAFAIRGTLDPGVECALPALQENTNLKGDLQNALLAAKASIRARQLKFQNRPAYLAHEASTSRHGEVTHWLNV